MVSANHDKAQGLSANAMVKSLKRKLFLYCTISIVWSTNNQNKCLTVWDNIHITINIDEKWLEN